MADNTVLDLGSGGNTVRTLEDGTSIHYPVGVVAFATTVGTPDVITIPVAAALSDTLTNPTTLLEGSCILVWTGTVWARAPGDATNGLLVNLGTNNDVTVSSITAGDNNIGNVDIVTVPADPFGANADAASATGSISAKLRFIAATGIPITGDALTALQAIQSIVGMEDATHSNGDPGVQMLAVRKDIAAALASVDGKYAPPITDSTGRLWCNVSNTVTVGSHAVTNAGTFAVQVDGAALTSLQLIDDAVAGAGFNISQMNGVAVSMGNGGSGTGVQRVTIASDSQGSLSTITAVGTVNAVTGITNALPTGDNVLGRVKLTDGTDVADVLDLTNSNPLTVAIVDGAGTQITSFGGGTQYTEGDTDASITGTAMLWEDAADTLRAVSATKPLPVNIISGAGSGGTAIQDGAVFTPDTTSLTPIGGYRDDTTPATVTEGDAASARITEFRALHVNLRDASGAEVAVGGGTQYTEDAIAAANPTGNALIVTRDDARSSGITSADLDNIALRGTNAGELYVKHYDSINVGLITTGVVPGTGDVYLGKAEDAPHTSGDVGVMALGVRQDSDASFAATTGDYVPFQFDANGFLKVNIKAGAGSGGTASTDDAAFTAASGSGTPMMGFVTTDAVDAGDVGVVGMLANRQLKVTLYDSAGVELAVGGGTQYTEDAPAAANPVGNALNLVRADALAGVTSADGDNVAARGTDKGELYVKHADTIAATQSGTWNITNISGTVSLPTGASTAANQATIVGHLDGVEGLLTTIDGDTGAIAGCVAGTELQVDILSIVPGTGATNLGKAEDAAHTTGDVGVMAMTVRQDTAAALGGTDADYQPLITDGSGRLHVAVGNTVTVSSHAVTNAGTFVVQIDGTALTRLTDIETNTDSGAVIGNGTAAAAQRVTIANDSTGILAGVTTVTTVTTCSTVTTLTTLTGSGIAHDAADSGNPHKIGAKAETALSGITLVADGDRTDLYAGIDGVLIVRPHANLEDLVSGVNSNTDGTSTEVIAAAGVGIKIYLTSVTVFNTSATAVYVELKSGTTVRWRLPVPPNTFGVTHTFNTPLAPNAANEAWNFDPSAAATTVFCSLAGFKSKV